MSFLESLLGSVGNKNEQQSKECCGECCGIVEVPDVRQKDHYSCGAACSMSVGGYFGVGPDTLEEWKSDLGTSVQESTHPTAIEKYFRKCGCEVKCDSFRTMDDLAECCKRDMPTIVCCQDYGPKVPEKARFTYGHYIVIIGRIPGYVIAQDPSEDNVVAGGDKKTLAATGSVQKPGRIIIADEDFLNVWKDQDAEGNKYIRWGCSIGRPMKSYGDADDDDDKADEPDGDEDDRPKAKLSIMAVKLPWQAGIPKPAGKDKY